MTINASHEGNDPMGALTTHRGLLENCGAPDCQDRVIEQQADAEPEPTEALRQEVDGMCNCCLTNRPRLRRMRKLLNMPADDFLADLEEEKGQLAP